MGWHNSRMPEGIDRSRKLTAAWANLHQRVHGTEDTSTMQLEMGKSPTAETSAIYMNHIKKEFGITRGDQLVANCSQTMKTQTHLTML